MRLKIKRYNAQCDDLFQLKVSLGNLDGGVYDALNLFIGKDDRFRKWLIRTNWDDAIAGSAIVLFRIMEIHKPDDSDQVRLDLVLDLINEFSDKSSPKLSALTAAVAAEMFEFLTLRNNQGAIRYLADELIRRSDTEIGLRSIQLILAPKDAAEESSSKILYSELRKPLEAHGDVKEWLEANIPTHLRLRAYQATKFEEVITSSTNRQRGKMIEMDLGL